MDEEQIQLNRRNAEEKATAERAMILGLPYLDTRDFENQVPLVKDLLDVQTMHRDMILPLQVGGGEKHFQFMVTSQTPRSVINEIRQAYTNDGEKADFFVISGSAYKTFMLRYDPPRQIHYDDIKIGSEGDSETIKSVSKTLEEVSTEKMFDFLIDQADKLQASDIHIENLRDKIRIRMRVDGILHPVADINRDKYRIFMGELSSRANVSMASNEPQSGHMQKDVTVNGKTHLLNIRVETIPTLYGQDAVLRLFNFDETLLNLDLLGLSKEERKEINEVISHPRGLVLMVGPTGSGKSTTLYSMLNALNTTERKIITLEDPIEYGITGISQIPIHTNEGGSFAEGLRSVLRLDPDVVMVGEIRDADTAKTAIQASITGHLVLSSFHANSTSAAFSRMIDLIGVNPIFSSSIRLVMAQRLVRQLSDTKKPRPATEAEAKYIHRVLEGVPSEKLPDVDMNNITLYEPVVSEGDPFGYKGRTVIMEQMLVTEEIQAYIRGDVTMINTKEIEKTARGGGMLTLEQKGVVAALKGETTLAEISRVI
ncbi:Flp pilus assembly complex ATPase component TadA [Candidatus Saccharibacteria bacterium]|nr:Flp pilus assembly complex ATPase component TadA [Candidatus Saccharibacteria bacterium]